MVNTSAWRSFAICTSNQSSRGAMDLWWAKAAVLLPLPKATNDALLQPNWALVMHAVQA